MPFLMTGTGRGLGSLAGNTSKAEAAMSSPVMLEMLMGPVGGAADTIAVSDICGVCAVSMAAGRLHGCNSRSG